MPGKDEEIKNPVVIAGEPAAISSAEIKKPWSVEQVYAWRAANFGTVALATTTCILAVQSPAKTVLVNLLSNKGMFPVSNAGLFGVAKLLYAGTGAAFGGSAVRTLWVSAAKDGAKPLEGALAREEAFARDTFAGDEALTESRALSEEGRLVAEVVSKEAAIEDKYAKGRRVVYMSLGEILLTNYSESLSTLRKTGVLSHDFKPYTMHNASKLISGGFLPRFGAGLINMASLCILEEKIAGRMSFIEDEGKKHFVSGALSGMAGALCSYPFALFKDYVQVQTKEIDGKLYNKGAFTAAKELYATFKGDRRTSLMEFGKMSLKQLPIRVGLTGLIFGIIGGVGATLGDEPLRKVAPEKLQPPTLAGSRDGFFAQAPRISPAAIEDKSATEAPPTRVEMR
jgi:hypothetical protein